MLGQRRVEQQAQMVVGLVSLGGGGSPLYAGLIVPSGGMEDGPGPDDSGKHL
jgi:hypothetical protein